MLRPLPIGPGPPGDVASLSTPSTMTRFPSGRTALLLGTAETPTGTTSGWLTLNIVPGADGTTLVPDTRHIDWPRHLHRRGERAPNHRRGIRPRRTPFTDWRNARGLAPRSGHAVALASCVSPVAPRAARS